MMSPSSLLKRPAAREALLFLVLFIVGVLFLPLAVYVVGQWVFGEYGGSGLIDFFARIYHGLPTGDGVVWFLVLSPYLGWQVLRLTIWVFRRCTPPATTESR